jgi:hypothetical protein
MLRELKAEGFRRELSVPTLETRGPTHLSTWYNIRRGAESVTVLPPNCRDQIRRSRNARNLIGEPTSRSGYNTFLTLDYICMRASGRAPSLKVHDIRYAPFPTTTCHVIASRMLRYERRYLCPIVIDGNIMLPGDWSPNRQAGLRTGI